MTITELQSDLALYIAARDRILEAGQSASIDGVQVDNARLEYIERKITEIRSRISMVNKGVLTHSVAVFGGSR